ncbi:hypothetical protein NMG60_11027227 [Bertholletia excelsa]
MEMDEEMEDSAELTFTAVEIDLDYEFDAARYFDFTREESSVDAREAELWFESAGSYPHSPFVTKLLLGDNILQDALSEFPKSKDMVNKTFPACEAAIREGESLSAIETTEKGCQVMNGGILAKVQSGGLLTNQTQNQQLPTGLKFFNPMVSDNSKVRNKSTVKMSLPRISTLMKPTASQLAKQNEARKMGDSRFQKLMAQNNEKSLNNPSGIEYQAAKRQKLEDGLLRKVTDAKEFNLAHKVPKKDASAEGNSLYTKLRLTIPREPDLATAHRAVRAQRTRAKDTREPECGTSTIYRFRALPLNRKILEAPSLSIPKRSIPRLPEFQEFHLKTSERAMQHASAGLSSSVPCGNTDKVSHKPCTDATGETGNGECRRSNIVTASKVEGHEFVRNFKARPLNKKIFSSKGGFGVFRNIKKEITVPMEFNFHTERSQHNPPIELFNKLSLIELQPNAKSQSQCSLPTSTTLKGSKENKPGSFQQEHEIKHLDKEKPPWFWEKQAPSGNDGGINEVAFSCVSRRSMGIR